MALRDRICSVTRVITLFFRIAHCAQRRLLILRTDHHRSVRYRQKLDSTPLWSSAGSNGRICGKDSRVKISVASRYCSAITSNPTARSAWISTSPRPWAWPEVGAPYCRVRPVGPSSISKNESWPNLERPAPPGVAPQAVNHFRYNLNLFRYSTFPFRLCRPERHCPVLIP